MSCEDVVISAEGVGKAYALFDRPEDRLRQMLFGRFRTYYREFWALSPTDLQIRAGETWGIIGRNGSGKSTLLQMICGNLRPTTGRIVVRGRIAALLELGAGFNPDFTGRENVYINGALVGFDRSQVDDRLDRILAFADIGPFIDQPVKTYSSGMFARLAFAVAINVDPDILVVDEALAVGDEGFQRKCFARIERIREDGATILFVSHAPQAINQLCDHALLLDAGQPLLVGPPKLAVFHYQKLSNASPEELPALIARLREGGAGRGAADADRKPAAEAADTPDDRPSEMAEVSDADLELLDGSLKSFPQAYEENGAAIARFALATVEGKPVNTIVSGRTYELVARVRFTQHCPSVRVYVLIRTTSGIDLAGCSYPRMRDKTLDFPAGAEIDFRFRFECTLTPGVYFTNVAVSGGAALLHHRIVDAFAFRVLENERSHATGLVDLDYRPGHELVEAVAS